MRDGSQEESDSKVLVVADAGDNAGLGHIARCSAVVAGLRTRSVTCRCVAVGVEQSSRSAFPWEAIDDVEQVPSTHPTLLLLDTYRLDPAFVVERTGAAGLVLMHDLGPVPTEAVLTVTTDPHLSEGNPRIVGGPHFSCLGPRFWGLPDPTPVRETVQRVLVTTGGGDPGGRALAVATSVKAVLPAAEIVLVRGPHATFSEPDGIAVLDRPTSLLEPLLEADLVVTAAGSTLFEALATGIPAVAMIMAENQVPAARALAEAGAAELSDPADLDGLANLVRRLASERERREQQSRRGRDLVDGYGALRVAFLLWRILAAR